MKLKIGNRFLAFVCVGGLFSSLTLGALIIGELEGSEKMLLQQSASMEQVVGEEAENFAKAQVNDELEDIIYLKAQCIELNTKEIKESLAFLSNYVTSCMKNPQNYKAVPLRAWEAEMIPNEMYYVPKGEGEAVPDLAGRIASIRREVLSLNERFSPQSINFFVAAESGWGLTMDCGQDLIDPQQTIFSSGVDWQNAVWYKMGKEHESPVYTTLYKLADGKSQIACVMPYKDADGFAGVVGISFSPKELYEDQQVKNVMSDARSLILNSQGQVLYSNFQSDDIPVGRTDFDLRQCGEASLAEAASHMANGEKGSMSVTVAGEEYALVYVHVDESDLSLGMFVPFSEVQNPVRSIRHVVSVATEEISQEFQQSLPLFRQQTLAMIGFVLLVIVLTGVVARYWIIRAINTLVAGVRRFAEGDFAHRIVLTTGDEMEELAGVYNSMADAIKRYMEKLAQVTEEKTRTEAELALAADMQQGILPQDFSSQSNCDIYGDMRSAKEVGGDFYDFYLLGRQELVVTIADVSDKGVPAALFMMMSKTILKNCVQNYGQESLAVAVQKANEQIKEENGEGLFVTVFVGRLNFVTGEFAYVNAGHSSPVLCRNGEMSALPKKRSPMLGIKKGISFAENQFSLRAGDMLFLYTDGVTEAMNEKQQMFGKEGMEAVLSKVADLPAKEIVNTMFQAIAVHGADVEQFDDITMLALKYDDKLQDDGAIHEWEVPADEDELDNLDGYKLYRKVLAEANDHSVKIIAIGFVSSLVQLLESGPDEYSDLPGKELVRRKVDSLYFMATKLEESKDPGYNLRYDLQLARRFLTEWPLEVKVYLSPNPVGGAIEYPAETVVKDLADFDGNPIQQVYLNKDCNTGQKMWDFLCVVNAVEPKKFNFSQPGFVSMNEAGEICFTKDQKGNFVYQLPGDKKWNDKMLAYLRSYLR